VSKATSCVKRAASDGVAAMVVSECAPSFPGLPGLDATPTSEASRPWSSTPTSPNTLATTTSDHGWQMVGNISTSALVTPAKPPASFPTLRVSRARLGPVTSSDIFLGSLGDVLVGVFFSDSNPPSHRHTTSTPLTMPTHNGPVAASAFQSQVHACSCTPIHDALANSNPCMSTSSSQSVWGLWPFVPRPVTVRLVVGRVLVCLLFPAPWRFVF
jgi:hypothetical protein